MLILTGCSRQRLGRDQARSALTNSVSLATEADMFLAFVAKKKSTTQFTRGHSLYLEQEVDKLTKLLSQSAPDSSIKTPVADARTELQLLHQELLHVSQNVQNPKQLAASQKKIDTIRRRLMSIERAL
jgi:hypothetical protein